MDFLTDSVFTDFGRSDFIGGIDNEALDFGQLDQFIHVTATTGSQSNDNAANTINVSTVSNGTVNSSVSISDGPTQSHLPESPPDSGSEPYSPADLQVLSLSQTASNSIIRGTNDNTNENGVIVNDCTNNAGAVSNSVSNTSPSHITINHSTITAITVPSNHTISIHDTNQNSDITSQIQGDLTDNITTLADISQTSIDLQAIEDLHQSHHHHHHHSLHHTILNTHPHNHFTQTQHHPQLSHQQQQLHHNINALYIRSNQNSDNQNTHQQNNGIRKHENILHETHQTPTDQQLMLQQTVNGVNFMDLERNCRNNPMNNTHPQQNLMSSVSSSSLSTEDLSRIIPEVYTGVHTTPTMNNRISIKTPNPTSCRKRKLSTPDAGSPTVKPEPVASSLSPVCVQHLEADSPIGTNTTINSNLSIHETSLDGGNVRNPDSTGSADSNCPLQCIRFSSFQQQNWHVLCDQSLQELPVPHYRIDADKGFNFSNSDDAFVCQKKNHFQITCHAQLQGNAAFVRTSNGLEKIKSFYLHFYGVKLEAPNHIIRVEQSQSDRSKKPFHPVPIDLKDHVVSKVTVGRLHFSETTSNNMRKKGRPNPEQRYFQLVVGLHAHTHSGHFPVVSQGSERIIVRASNPGQFESDVELCWSRGITQDSIFHAGRVGINTDRPDESLVVHGNIKVSGHIVQPSDSRAKQEITELDTSEQLKNLQKIRVVKYRYEPEFAIHSGLKDKNDTEEIIDTGVIAQEVREVLPDAVQEAGSIVLPNGQIIENFLLVNKDRILMENIGAVKELCKVTGSLETRIEQLEKINSRLVRMQQNDRGHNCTTKRCKHLPNDSDDTEEICSNKVIQIIIVILVIIMASCLIAISTLYFVEHGKQNSRVITRYDVNQYISEDDIYVNDNIPPNQNDYYLDKRPNGNQPNLKTNSFSSPFTIRPKSSASSSIQQSRRTSSSEDPPQEIITYQYFSPSDKNNRDGSYNENNTNTNHNDSDRSLNKGNGIKWSSSSTPNDDNSSKTSSEKIVSEPILLPHDVENNSIDGDHTQRPKLGNSKKIGSKKLSLTTHKPLNNDTNSNNIEINKSTSSITNKSRANNEDTDLQYLSNNSEIDDQNNFDLSTNPILSKVIVIEPIGMPVHCENPIKKANECQSVCCGDSNNLPLQQSNEDNNNNFEIDAIQSNVTIKEIHNHESLFAEIDEVKKTFKLSETTNIKIQKDHKASQTASVASNNHHHHHHHRQQECFPIPVWIRSETFNTTLGSETFCFGNGHNLNLSYSIPLSKYMKENKIELQFMGSNRLQWIICSNKQQTGLSKDYTNNKESDIVNNNINNRKIFQKNPNKSLFFINLPSNGFFERYVSIRASINLTKNTCQEQADNTSNILEYNFRIFRDCDK